MAAYMGKMLSLEVLLLFCLFFVFAQSINKYSETANQKPKKEMYERNFRINKVNLAWEKAQKRLSSDKLADLYAELKIQDKLELEAKRRRTDRLDDNGEFEATVRAKLLDILTRYNLHDHWEQRDSNFIIENESLDDKKLNKYDAIKMDKKLSKLWKKAEMSGFTDKELTELKKEFHHHQSKIDEFNQLKNEIDALEGISDNSVDTMKHPHFDRKNVKSKRDELKKRHHSLKESYSYLEGLTDQNSQDSDTMQFNDHKVIELWLLAKKANFTEIELQSFKEELKHFEHKILKHEHFQKELLAAQEFGNNAGKDNSAHWSSADLEKKVNDYGYKVKKYHTELKTRLAKAMEYHTEL